MNDYRQLYNEGFSLEKQESLECLETMEASRISTSSSVCSRRTTVEKVPDKQLGRRATNSSSTASVVTHRSTRTTGTRGTNSPSTASVVTHRSTRTSGTRGTKSSCTASVLTHRSTRTTRTRDTDMHQYLRKTLRCIAQNDIKTTEVVLNGASFQQQETMVVLAMSLANNTHIRILHLHDCQINDLGANLLASSLQRNKSIEQLWLNGNNIGDVGAEAIANALHANSTLKTVGLNNNVIGRYGGKRIRDSLKQNKVITDIFLRGNPISDKITCDIYSCCERNSHEKFGKKCSASSVVSRSPKKAEGRKVQPDRLRSTQEQLQFDQLHDMQSIVSRKRNSVVAPCA